MASLPSERCGRDDIRRSFSAVCLCGDFAKFRLRSLLCFHADLRFVAALVTALVNDRRTERITGSGGRAERQP